MVFWAVARGAGGLDGTLDGGEEVLSPGVVDNPRSVLRVWYSTDSFPSVLYLLRWVSDLADWGADEGPERPAFEVKAGGGVEAAVDGSVRVLEATGAAGVLARDVLKATGVISGPRILVWLPGWFTRLTLP